MKSYELTAGERFRIDDGEQFALIESGKVEVYAVTRADGSFRQEFLVALTAGGTAAFSDKIIVRVCAST